MKTQTATKSQYILLSAQAGRLLLSLVITAFLGRWLAPDAFGFFALISLLFILTNEIMDMGTNSIACRQISRTPSAEKKILEGLYAWRRLIGFMLAAITIFVGYTFYGGQTEQRWILYAASIGLLVVQLNAYNVLFTIRQQFGATTLLNLGCQVAFLVACVGLLNAKISGFFISLLVIVRESVFIFFNYRLALRLASERPQPKLFDPNIIPLLKNSLVFGLTALMYNFYFHTGVLAVWALSTEEELGALTASYRLIFPLLGIMWVLLTPLTPIFNRCYIDDKPQLHRHFYTFFQFLIGIAALLSVAGIYLADNILSLLYGNVYSSGPLSSVFALQWFSVAFSFSIVTPLLVITFIAQKAEKLLLWISLTGLLASIMLNFTLISGFGFAGAAIAITITELLVFIATIATGIFLKILPVPRIQIITTFLPAVLLFIILYLLSSWPMLELIIGTLATLLFIIFMWNMPRMCNSRKELNQDLQE